MDSQQGLNDPTKSLAASFSEPCKIMKYIEPTNQFAATFSPSCKYLGPVLITVLYIVAEGSIHSQVGYFISYIPLNHLTKNEK